MRPWKTGQITSSIRIGCTNSRRRALPDALVELFAYVALSPALMLDREDAAAGFLRLLDEAVRRVGEKWFLLPVADPANRRSAAYRDVFTVLSSITGFARCVTGRRAPLPGRVRATYCPERSTRPG